MVTTGKTQRELMLIYHTKMQCFHTQMRTYTHECESTYKRKQKHTHVYLTHIYEPKNPLKFNV